MTCNWKKCELLQTLSSHIRPKGKEKNPEGVFSFVKSIPGWKGHLKNQGSKDD